MTTIKAEIIADSINGYGNRLTTMQLRYPRWIHAEGRTHRQMHIGESEFYYDDALYGEPRTPSLMEDPNLSRNASSSRAIPVSKLIQDVIDDPAVPIFWGKNQKGMQADEECNESVLLRYEGTSFLNYTREQAWLEARNRAIEIARAYDGAGYHKQIVNRLLEPFSHINVVVTATEWTNFFGLRRHKDAEPHINLLADRMWEAMQSSKPRVLLPGEWHLPYVDRAELQRYGFDAAIKMSVARCASVSYKTVDGLDMTPERAVSLYDRLLSAQPLHASPAEHQGTPDDKFYPPRVGWKNPNQHGNFKGWIQYRKTLPGECILI